MYGCHIFVLVFCIIIYTAKNVRSDYILSINASSNTKTFTHFWKSTGFCPPEPRSNISQYLQRKDVKLNIALIGALPNRSIRHIRVHWLLDLIKIRSFKNDGTPVYDFANLDLFLDWLHLQKLYPGFEIMGNPSSYFTNFLDQHQMIYWELLVREILTRYSEKYSVKNVSKWRFETWNEPDLKGYNTVNFTLASYISYINATVLGLYNKTIKYKFGGPAGLFKSPKKHPLCWGIISECVSGKFPLNFISFHKKGDGTSKGVIDKGLELVKYIHKTYPSLKKLPIANDEADILTGWSKSMEWRGDVRYAAMIVKVIIDHYNKFIKELKIDIEVLSNDNGFLNFHPYYFTQRTLLARFQMNNTNPPHIQIFKKPVYSVMALLSYLGKKVITLPLNNNYSIIATTNQHNENTEYSIMLSYVNDAIENKTERNFNISVKNLPKQDYIYVVYLLNNNITNPYKVWQKFKAPVFPQIQVRRLMRLVEGPIKYKNPTTILSTTEIDVYIQTNLPCVALLHICTTNKNSPGKVTGLQIYHITYNEVVVVWKDTQVKTKCILTYEVEFSRLYNNSFEEFRKIYFNDVIFLWYQYVAIGDDPATQGLYRVRAVDYWGKSGPYSKAVKYP